jgi:outer membrane murein-binding lipoprotein Lpp
MISLRRWPVLASSALLMSVLLAGCVSTPTNAPSAATQQRIEAAQTRADHEALAASYDKDAADARAAAANHRRMAKSYQSYQPGRGGGNMTAHCNSVAANYDRIATEYDGMAIMHRQLASQAKS